MATYLIAVKEIFVPLAGIFQPEVVIANGPFERLPMRSVAQG